MHEYFKRIKPLLEQLGCTKFKSYGWWSMDFVGPIGGEFHILVTPLLHRIFLRQREVGDLGEWQTIDPCLVELSKIFSQSSEKEVANEV